MLNKMIYYLFGKILVPAETFSHLCDTREQYKELAEHYKSLYYHVVDQNPLPEGEDEIVAYIPLEE